MLLSMSLDQMIYKMGEFAFGEVQGDLNMLAVALAGILLAISLIKMANDYINAESTGFGLIKPVIIFLCVCAYPAVSGTVKQVTDVFTSRIVSHLHVDTEEVFTNILESCSKFSENKIAQKIEEVDQSKQDWKESVGLMSHLRSGWDFIKNTVSIYLEKYYEGSFRLTYLLLLGAVFKLLIEIIFYVLLFVSGIYLLILRVFGCFMFAMAVLPNYSSGITNWISRYIQISLWAPLCYVVLALGNGLFLSLGDADLGGNFGMGWLVFLGEVVLAFCLLTVPSLAAWFVESAGSNRVHNSMGGAAAQVARKIITKGA